MKVKTIQPRLKEFFGYMIFLRGLKSASHCEIIIWYNSV